MMKMLETWENETCIGKVNGKLQLTGSKKIVVHLLNCPGSPQYSDETELCRT